MNPKPQPGYYRNIIGGIFPMIRIAFTNVPMYGVKRVDSNNVIELLKQSNDEFAQYYIDGLTNETMVTIVETYDENRYYSVGELYFKS